jgi:hypothetical protein
MNLEKLEDILIFLLVIFIPVAMIFGLVIDLFGGFNV